MSSPIKEFYMEITMENYYDNLKAHGYTEDDLPMLSSKGSQQYSDAMSNFDDSWETVWINGGNQVDVETGDFTQKALYVFTKDGKYRGLLIDYMFYLPDDGNYFEMDYEIIDFKSEDEVINYIKNFAKMDEVELEFQTRIRA